MDKPIGLPNIPDITLASVSIFLWIRLLVVQIIAWHTLKNCWLSYYGANKNPCAHIIAGYPSATVIGLSVRSLAPATKKFSLCDYKTFTLNFFFVYYYIIMLYITYYFEFNVIWNYFLANWVVTSKSWH